MKLRNKISREITKASITVLVICLCLFVPWQSHKSNLVNKKLVALIQSFITKDTLPLANAIFEQRKRSIDLRIEELFKVDGIRGAAVFDAKGNVLSSRNMRVDIKDVQQHFDQARMNSLTSWTDKNVLMYLQAVKAFNEVEGFILIEYSLADMKEKEKMSLLFYSLIFVSLILIMLFLTNRLIRKIILVPVDRLIKNMAQIEKGRYGTQISPVSEDEIGDLAKRFNAMSTEIDTTYRQVENQNEQLKKTKNLLDGIINSMPSILLTIDKECRIKQWNTKTEESSDFDISSASDKNLADIFSFAGPLIPELKVSLKNKKSKKFSKIECRINKSKRYYDLIVYPIESGFEEVAVIIIDDVTTRVHMETMMIQSEKIMSVGGLAAGMAHEINNPLAGMIQNAQVISNRLMKDLPGNIKAAGELGISMNVIRSYMEKREIEKLIAGIQKSGNRAAKIVQNMLSFSRESTAQLYNCRLSDILDATIHLSENDYDLKKKFDFREIEIIREYDPSAPGVDCNESQIQQVFFNIIKNSTEAMSTQLKPKEKNRIYLRVKRMETSVQVEIEDNGPGMADDVQKRIFEPFFTTKEVGVGTGLGLSVSYFIITENHKGKMWVESTEGSGTRFTIQIPIMAGPSYS